MLEKVLDFQKKTSMFLTSMHTSDMSHRKKKHRCFFEVDTPTKDGEIILEDGWTESFLPG